MWNGEWDYPVFYREDRRGFCVWLTSKKVYTTAWTDSVKEAPCVRLEAVKSNGLTDSFNKSQIFIRSKICKLVFRKSSAVFYSIRAEHSQGKFNRAERTRQLIDLFCLTDFISSFHLLLFQSFFMHGPKGKQSG